MTVTGRLLHIIGNRTKYSLDVRYDTFYSSYSGSDAQSRNNRLQPLFWVAGTILSLIIPEYFNTPVSVSLPLINRSLPVSVVIITIFGVFGILLITIIGPGWYYYKNRPFKFELTWYPITTESKLLRDSHEDKLRLPSEKIRIVIYFDVVGKIDGYNFKITTTDDNIVFKLYPEMGMSQQSYSDSKGVYSSMPVENDTVFNIYEVEKLVPLAGDPGHKLKIIDVPETDSEGYSREVTDQKAKETGDEVLSIEVTE